ncbi:MAG: sensor histidine kinase [Coriobacteriia bacterium]
MGGTVDGGAPNARRRAGGALARPATLALLESQPIPAFFVGEPPSLVLSNAGARRFLSDTPEGGRVLADDGTDLWTIIRGRSDEADPFFDMNIRLRDSDGHPLLVTLSIVPVGTHKGLVGAMAFVLNIPSERLNEACARPMLFGEGLHAIAERIGVLVEADTVYVIEIDQDDASEARVRAHWSVNSDPLGLARFSLNGSPSGAFRGRRVLVIPSGVAEAFPNSVKTAGFEAYVGVALTGPRGVHIGTLSAMWKEPLQDASGMAAALSIASMGAARALSDAMARQELLESEQRYGSVFQGSAIPILLVEPVTTQLVDANPAACAFYGFSREEFLSMSILQVDSLAAEALKAELARALDGSRGHFVGQHILSGGRLRDVEITIGPIRVAGRPLLYCMVNDITERKRLEAELERSKRDLVHVVGQRTEDLLRANTEFQQVSMARDSVVRNLAQELRTSLQTINGFSGLLLRGMAGSLTEEQRRQVEMVQRAGLGLAEFASALVQSRSAQDSEPALTREEFDLVSLVESVLLGLASFAQDKGLTLRFDAEQRPVLVRTDRYKALQVLLNILSNAIRYTVEGGVTATVVREPAGEVLVTVQDTGPGIEPGAIATLFEGPEVDHAKVGIGLPASRRLATLLGGTIEVMSEVGAGSAFTLRLPGPAVTDDQPERRDETDA